MDQRVHGDYHRGYRGDPRSLDCGSSRAQILLPVASASVQPAEPRAKDLADDRGRISQAPKIRYD